MHTDSKMFTTGTDDFKPLEFFKLKWRWDPSNQPEIRPDQLALIHPLRKEISQKAWLASMSLEDNKHEHYTYPNRNLFSKILELNVRDLDYELVKGWIENLPVNHEEFVVVCWDESTAVKTTFQMFIHFWDDFWYPGDDISIWPLSFEWVLLCWHEEVFYFGYNPVQ